MHNTPGRHHHVLLGLILIILGVLFLLSMLDVVDFGHLIGTWWPLILIAVGLRKMTTQGSDRYTGGLIILGLGVFFQLMELDVLGWGLFRYLWPVILILIGLKMLLSPRREGGGSSRPINKNTIDAVSLFGGSENRIVSQSFTGGQATAIFGGVDINLREARLNTGQATLHATAIFGGVDIICPDGWKIEIGGSSLFGALKNTCKTTNDPDAPTLIIKGSALFGDIEVKH